MIGVHRNTKNLIEELILYFLATIGGLAKALKPLALKCFVLKIKNKVVNERCICLD